MPVVRRAVREVFVNTALFPEMTRTATISPCQKYRYSLRRAWQEGSRIACFIMLNPSTADARQDDPTIRRCIGFSQDWHMDALEVVNLFAWRATDPQSLKVCPSPEGPMNNDYILQAAWRATTIIVAWGSNPYAQSRRLAVSALLKRFPLFCVGTNRDGNPKHPLYAKPVEHPLLWRGAML